MDGLPWTPVSDMERTLHPLLGEILATLEKDTANACDGGAVPPPLAAHVRAAIAATSVPEHSIDLEVVRVRWARAAAADGRLVAMLRDTPMCGVTSALPLWHCGPRDVIAAVAEHGFSARPKSELAMFGAALYFASSATKAANFCRHARDAAINTSRPCSSCAPPGVADTWDLLLAVVGFGSDGPVKVLGESLSQDATLETRDLLVESKDFDPAAELYSREWVVRSDSRAVPALVVTIRRRLVAAE